MRVEFVHRQGGPQRLEADAELVFDEDGPLQGMKLVGFSIWKGADGLRYVTFPSRSYGAGDERRFFDHLRSVEAAAEPVRRVKDWILRQYEQHSRAA